ncbi:glycosyl transferase [Labrenzia sp. CP4]|jgi:alpha-N-acetylglucosamine transferase|uniref:glycosyltransferase n=1 Tax=Labrenzia sp. CP4 TaxID=1674922 RepID=UPI0007853DAF|nr:glycosyltransferase [Labrenzia sp. CP4]AMN53202.1 glycosyl transferase [Labrenzia sp. CP4]
MQDAPQFDRAPGSTFAYVTLVTNRDYVLGATALLRSLRHSGTEADLVVLYTPGVGEADLAALAEFGPRLGRCERLPTSESFNARHERGRIHKAAPFTKGGKPVFHTPLDNFVKLRLWQLEEYDRVIFIDADAIVLQNCDKLFDYPEFCAAPNVYESLQDFHRLNSGVFTARPNMATFEAMLARLDRPEAFWRRTDQTFLEDYFPDWHGLPVLFNTLQYVWFNLPELWNWKQIHVLHYQYEKPWQEGHEKTAKLRPLIDLWQAFATGVDIPDDVTGLPGPLEWVAKQAS